MKHIDSKKRSETYFKQYTSKTSIFLLSVIEQKKIIGLRLLRTSINLELRKYLFFKSIEFNKTSLRQFKYKGLNKLMIIPF